MVYLLFSSKPDWKPGRSPYKPQKEFLCPDGEALLIYPDSGVMRRNAPSGQTGGSTDSFVKRYCTFLGRRLHLMPCGTYCLRQSILVYCNMIYINVNHFENQKLVH